MKKILTLLILLPRLAYSQSKCKGITTQVDEFRHIETSTHKRLDSDMQLARMSKGDTVQYGIKLSLLSYKENYNAEGVFVKLKSGKTVERPLEPVDIQYYGDDFYQYSGQIVLTQEEFELFTLEPTVLFQLGTYSRKVGEYDGPALMRYARCLK